MPLDQVMDAEVREILRRDLSRGLMEINADHVRIVREELRRTHNQRR